MFRKPLTPKAFGPSPDQRPWVRLGQVLRRNGAISAETLDRALIRQSEVNQPLGHILHAAGDISERTLASALAEQNGQISLDLGGHPCDPRLSEDMDPEALLRLGFLPWRRVGSRIICAAADPAAIPRLRDMLGQQADKLSFVITAQSALEREILRLHGDRLTRRARTRCAARYSCRSWATPGGRTALIGVLAGLLALILAAPGQALIALIVWIALMNTATTFLRGFALFDSFRPEKPLPPQAENVISLPMAGGLPVISLLVPLYHEAATLRQLIASLRHATYPKELLDVIVILESDDVSTPLALARLTLPPWVRVITAPPDPIRTKPRAMNLALSFARGEIVGIYDAEDRPEPDQLMKVAHHLAHAPPEVGCVQGYLDFYNARQNWLSRCFTIEYSIWFRVLLRGVQRLGIPLPLGGTTVFFRRPALEAVGGWDAHNVTEDADLGMRLARFGYRTEMVATTTHEEANCRVRPWIRQRARWLKGYAMTWITHMRRPAALWRDLGPAGFFGFQLLLLGGLTAYLATPLFWVLWLGYLGADLALFEMGSGVLWAAFFASMVIGQLVMLSVALRAIWSRQRWHLLRAIPILLLYWPLGAIAAYRAVTEIVTRPFHWEKTEHGL
ncbi:glycosyltransferase family 2 protein [Oceanibium sediminis]|uniref:glycosyltransferase family 2 protein n=1 Tax=Oceanibium sediminis TaxID=2026339 RepID=UPI000DD3E064|nr:glycosyltransferase family 2 protein [Oceanibium sediminis]